MSQTSTAQPEDTKAIIDELFNRQPMSDAELKERLSRCNMTWARKFLVERLRQQTDPDNSALLTAALRHSDVPQMADELLDIAQWAANSAVSRAIALDLLVAECPDQARKLANRLSPESLGRITESHIAEFVASLEGDSEAAKVVAEFLLHAPGSIRSLVLEDFEQRRLQADIPAASVYEVALTQELLASLHEAMLAALVADGGRSSETLVTRLRDAAAPAQRAKFQKALLKLTTSRIDPRQGVKKTPGSFAYVGSADGQGAFVILGRIKKKIGKFSTVNLCIRAAADIRDGFVLPRHSDGEFKKMRQEIQGSWCNFVRVPLPIAGQIVAAAVARTEALGISLTADSQSAVRAFEHACNIDPLVTDEVKPARPFDDVLLHGIMSKPIYRYWFFDQGDLNSVGIDTPGFFEDREMWIRKSATALNTAKVKQRLVAMAKYMARWHQWNSEPELAAALAAAAQAVEKDFSGSTLLRTFLDKSYEYTAGVNSRSRPAASEKDALEQRDQLRRCCFAGLKSPKRQDLAYLDHVEVAFRTLDHSINLIAGDRRPRNDDLYDIAYAAAQVHVEHRCKQTGSGEGIEQHIIRVVQDKNTLSALSTEEARIIAGPIIDAMQEFSEQQCGHCLLDCLSHPQADAAQPFYSPQHPFQPKSSGTEMQSSRGYCEYRTMLSTTMDENDDEEDGAEDLRTKLEDLFEHSPEGQALINEDVDLGWCGIFMEYAHSYHGSLPHEILASEARDIVFSLFPRKVVCAAEDAGEIVSCLRGFWHFLGCEFGFKNADACLQVLGARAAGKLQRELSNPANFSMGKSFAMEGAERGFDLTSETGLQSWMDTYSKELPELPGEAMPRLPSFDDQMPWGGDDYAPASSHTKKQTKDKRKRARKARKANRKKR